MPSFNKVLLMGNLTRDPELRNTTNGSAVCEFSIAVNRRWNDRNTGQQREEVGFFDCVAWGRTAEVIAQYMAKGRPIFIEGRLVQDRWEGQDGKKHSRVKVNVVTMQFLGSKNGADASQARPHPEDVGGELAGGGPEDEVPF